MSIKVKAAASIAFLEGAKKMFADDDTKFTTTIAPLVNHIVKQRVFSIKELNNENLHVIYKRFSDDESKRKKLISTSE